MPLHRVQQRRGPLSRARCAKHAKPPHLFDRWAEVAEGIRFAPRVVLFLDFDGTLTPLRRRPEEVRPLGIALRRLLHRLARRRKLTLYVISGRALADLRRLVPVRGLHLLGLHGWEGRTTRTFSRERGLLKKARQKLHQRLGGMQGVWIENKGLGVAVHYREASPKSVRMAHSIMKEVAKEFRPSLRMMRGKKIWELVPEAINGKGPAVEALLTGASAGTLPVFVGDDTTDEAAFEALPGGLTIRVGKHAGTYAQYALRDPGEVKDFLERLEGELI